jgi:hypothetical protein
MSVARVNRELICGLLSKHFKRRVNHFVITNTEPPVIGKACRTCLINPLDNELKISNIRALRNFSEMVGQPLTLMEGKWALTHWSKWIAFVDEHNRLPNRGYGSGPDEGVLK